MFVAYVVVAALLGAALLVSGLSKLLRAQWAIEPIAALGVPLSWFPFLGLALVAGAAGLVGGIFWVPIGIAAASGVVLYFVGALVAHIRANNTDYGGPIALGLAALVALVLRALSA